MSRAGIDTSQYKSHSTRGASASYLTSKHVDVKDIMRSAGWSKEETFRRFYNFEHNSTFKYGTAILGATVKCRPPDHVKCKPCLKTGSYSELLKWLRLWERLAAVCYMFHFSFMHRLQAIADCQESE